MSSFVTFLQTKVLFLVSFATIDAISSHLWLLSLIGRQKCQILSLVSISPQQFLPQALEVVEKRP